MNYVVWALVAMVAYSFAFLFMKVAMRGLPTFTVMPIAVVTLAVGGTVAATLLGRWETPALGDRHLLFALAAGLCLAGAVVGYFQALSAGPVSVVVPVFGMFLVGGAVLGVVVLNEPLTARKALGVVLGAAAVVLLAT